MNMSQSRLTKGDLCIYGRHDRKEVSPSERLQVKQGLDATSETSF